MQQNWSINQHRDMRSASTLPAIAVVLLAAVALCSALRTVGTLSLHGMPLQLQVQMTVSILPSTLGLAAAVLAIGQATNPVRWLSVTALVTAAVAFVLGSGQVAVAAAASEFDMIQTARVVLTALCALSATLGLVGKSARHAQRQKSLLLWSLVVACIASCADLLLMRHLTGPAFFIVSSIIITLVHTAGVAFISWHRPVVRVIGLTLLALLIAYTFTLAASEIIDHLSENFIPLLFAIVVLNALTVAALVLVAISIPPLLRSRRTQSAAHDQLVQSL